jgi:type IV secretory pathway VirJ component
VILMGYSMGSDILPFAFNLLTEKTKSKCSSLVMIAPDQLAQFEIKLMNYISPPITGKSVYDELTKINQCPVYIICDDSETALCHRLDNATWNFQLLPGGHHFDGDYSTLNRMIGKLLGVKD